MKYVVMLPMLTILVLVMALVAKVYHENWNGNAKQSCPEMDSRHYMHSGRSAKEGERCGYLPGDLPRCINSQLHLPLVDDDNTELVCQSHVCVEKKNEGKDCSTRNANGGISPLPDVCHSGVCLHNEGEGPMYLCAEANTRETYKNCTKNLDCMTSDYCSSYNNSCMPRIKEDELCNHTDLAHATLPNDMSLQCEADHYCLENRGERRCRPLTHGQPHTGTACPWNNTRGDKRPECALGRAFCNEQSICTRHIAADQKCMFNNRAGYDDALMPCVYGYACHPKTNPRNTTDAWVEGTCTLARGKMAGETAFLEEFCEYGLYLDTTKNICTEPLKTKQTCSSNSDCYDSASDAGKISCQCTKALTLGAPGMCRKEPLSHPSTPHIKYDARCKNEFRDYTVYLEQHWKESEMTEDGREEYDKRAHSLARKGLCCMKQTVRKQSHMWYMSGLFLIDFVDAGVHCNNDLVWLWIVVAVLGSATLFGVCVAVREALSDDEVMPDEQNMPFGSEVDNEDGVDVVKELINKTTLDEAKMSSGRNTPVRAPGTSAH